MHPKIILVGKGTHSELKISQQHAKNELTGKNRMGKIGLIGKVSIIPKPLEVIFSQNSEKLGTINP